MKKTITQEVNITKQELENAQKQSWGGVVALQARVEDKENNRFTDCFVRLYVNNRNRVVFELSHERGYPSENKGSVRKEITASWVSNEIPKL